VTQRDYPALFGLTVGEPLQNLVDPVRVY